MRGGRCVGLCIACTLPLHAACTRPPAAAYLQWTLGEMPVSARYLVYNSSVKRHKQREGGREWTCSPRHEIICPSCDRFWVVFHVNNSPTWNFKRRGDTRPVLLRRPKGTIDQQTWDTVRNFWYALQSNNEHVVQPSASLKEDFRQQPRALAASKQASMGMC